jgi:hypothetical protein
VAAAEAGHGGHASRPNNAPEPQQLGNPISSHGTSWNDIPFLDYIYTYIYSIHTYIYTIYLNSDI